MRTHLLISRAGLGRLTAVAACAALTLALAPGADAAAGKIGPVTGLAATVTKPAASYRVASTWHSLTGATSYRVALTAAGVSLASGTVTTTAWTASTTRPAGTTVTVKVTPIAGKRPGKAASFATTLPDVTPPVGTYHLDQTGPDVVVTEDSLSDDLTPQGSILRSIDWGDGAGWETWATTHHYATDGVRYPQVRLVDQAANTAVVPLHVVVVGDTTAPTGAFTISPATGWAKLTPVRITQTAIHDDYSSDAHVARVVDWNDGSPTVTWSTGTTLDHVYAVGGSHTPVVRLTDEAGNAAAPITLDPVVSNVDAVAPRVSLTRPTTQRSYVVRWTTLKGRATDTGGTGVRTVRLRMVEKRGLAWYGYRPATHSWAKAATRAAATTKSRLASVRPTALHTWSYRMRGLAKGTLFISRSGTDRVGNTSKTVVYKQVLTHK